MGHLVVDLQNIQGNSLFFIHSYFLCLCHCWSCWCLCQSEVCSASRGQTQVFQLLHTPENVREAQKRRLSEGPFSTLEASQLQKRRLFTDTWTELENREERIAVPARHWMLCYKLFLINEGCFPEATAVHSWRDLTAFCTAQPSFPHINEGANLHVQIMEKKKDLKNFSFLL